ncbi:MAG: leucyl aminopeptidase family protein [Pseudomonadota bacterium]
MRNTSLSSQADGATPVYIASEAELSSVAAQLGPVAKQWLSAINFKAQPGKTAILPAQDGSIECAIIGAPLDNDPFAQFKFANLIKTLPAGNYCLASETSSKDAIGLAWLLGGYKFDLYSAGENASRSLFIPDNASQSEIESIADGVCLTRDLINTPANDMGPSKLEEAVSKIASDYGAEFSSVVGDELLTQNFPMIHAVGRASSDAPRLLELRWGNPDRPNITLVGKGVTFDTGGLNIKSGNNMLLMKKDMGGAANVLGLASMIMSANLAVNLHVLVPVAENAISGNSFRPGDVLSSRKGISVEIGNTDAEGRLILGDALAYADEEHPELIINMATLTGAARVAVGPDLAPFYSDDEDLCSAIVAASEEVIDPVWRMPIWPPYSSMLESKVADINHTSMGMFAGSITASLFLSKFVENSKSWCHFDIFGWVPVAKPWAPVGGEAQGIRALFKMLSKKYPAV